MSDTKTQLYWAYGSNLNVRQMQRRCPGAKKMKALTVYGAKLIFRGVADIELTNVAEDAALGGLWRINTKHEDELDRYEGIRSGTYEKMYFYLRDKHRHYHKVLFYKMNSEGVLPPNERYLDTIVEGYQDFGLDLNKLDEALSRSWGEKVRTPDMQDRYLRNQSRLARSLDRVRRPNLADTDFIGPAEKPKPKANPGFVSADEMLAKFDKVSKREETTEKPEGFTRRPDGERHNKLDDAPDWLSEQYRDTMGYSPPEYRRRPNGGPSWSPKHKRGGSDLDRYLRNHNVVVNTKHHETKPVVGPDSKLIPAKRKKNKAPKNDPEQARLQRQLNLAEQRPAGYETLSPEEQAVVDADIIKQMEGK